MASVQPPQLRFFSLLRQWGWTSAESCCHFTLSTQKHEVRHLRCNCLHFLWEFFSFKKDTIIECWHEHWFSIFIHIWAQSVLLIHCVWLAASAAAADNSEWLLHFTLSILVFSVTTKPKSSAQHFGASGSPPTMHLCCSPGPSTWLHSLLSSVCLSSRASFTFSYPSILLTWLIGLTGHLPAFILLLRAAFAARPPLVLSLPILYFSSFLFLLLLW